MQIAGTDLIATLVQVLRDAPVLPELDLTMSPSDGTIIDMVRDDGSTVSVQVHTMPEGVTVIDGNVLLGPRWVAAIDDAIAANREQASILATYPDFQFYDPCGTSTIEVGGVTYYQMYREEVAELDTSRYPLPASQGFARVAPPDPGDDIGTLVVYADGIARFESQTGIVEWFTTDERTYNWVC